jgi:hypothetical protein
MESKLKIIGRCGMYKPLNFKSSVTLARVQFEDDQRIRHQFLEFLKADDGIVEILDAYNAAPLLELKGEELKKAIREAM